MKTNQPANARNRRSANRRPNRRRLLPVLRPSQNMRDIIKQLVMLEDHLFHPQKRCKDCIRKHFLTIEGLAEECATLCKPRAILPETRKVATGVRVLHHVWEQRTSDPHAAEMVAGKLRKLRKGLMTRFSSLPLNKLPSNETEQVNRYLRSLGPSSSGRSSSGRSPPGRSAAVRAQVMQRLRQVRLRGLPVLRARRGAQ